jgi:hypothetical protein
MFAEVVDKSPASRGFDRAGFVHQAGWRVAINIAVSPDA